MAVPACPSGSQTPPMQEPRSFPTTAARESLARRFGLPFSPDMQDWEWDVADAQRIQEFTAAYRDCPDLTNAERFSLMEMMVQCLDDLQDDPQAERSWDSIAPLLLANWELHAGTVAYWSCTDASAAQEQFHVSPRMGRLLMRRTDPGNRP